jgi:hypothetical protein
MAMLTDTVWSDSVYGEPLIVTLNASAVEASPTCW